jgi:predicted permease
VPLLEPAGLGGRTLLRAVVGLAKRRDLLLVALLLLGGAGGAGVASVTVSHRYMNTRPVGVEEPESVRWLAWVLQVGSREHVNQVFSYPQVQSLRQAVGEQAVGAVSKRSLILGRGTDAAPVEVKAVTRSYFDVLRTKPHMGRLFGSSQRPELEAVLGYSFWKSRFGAREDALGEQLELGSGRYTVVGVAPRGFTGADGVTANVFVPLEALGPLEDGEEWSSPGRFSLKVLFRFAPADGVTVPAAEGTFTSILASVEGVPPGMKMNRVVSYPLGLTSSPTVGRAARVAPWLRWTGIAVFLVAATNLSVAFLVDGTRRRVEYAVRLALGASLERVVLGVAGQASVLCFASLSVGTIVWAGVTRWLTVAIRFDEVSGFSSLGPAGVALAFLACVAVTSLLCGVLPAVVSVGAAARQGLRSSEGRESRSFSLARGLLLLGQAASFMVLSVAAFLFYQSLTAAQAVDIGMSTQNVFLVSPVRERGSRVPPRDWFVEAAQRVELLPGVETVAAVGPAPLGGVRGIPVTVPPGESDEPGVGLESAYAVSVVGEFSRAVGLRIIEGRTFSEDELRGSGRSVLVNESFANRAFGGERSLGRCVVLGVPEGPCSDIVGVVRDVRRFTLQEESSPMLWVPYEQGLIDLVPNTLVVRLADPPLSDVDAAVSGIRGVFPEARYVEVLDLDNRVAGWYAQWSTGLKLSGAAVLLAVVVSACGVTIVVLQHTISQRAALATRYALGATRLDLAKCATAFTWPWVLGGVLAGMVVCLASHKLLLTLAFGFEGRWIAFAILGALGTSGTLGLIAGIVGWIAAGRDPVGDLRM